MIVKGQLRLAQHDSHVCHRLCSVVHAAEQNGFQRLTAMNGVWVAR